MQLNVRLTPLELDFLAAARRVAEGPPAELTLANIVSVEIAALRRLRSGSPPPELLLAGSTCTISAEEAALVRARHAKNPNFKLPAFGPVG